MRWRPAPPFNQAPEFTSLLWTSVRIVPVAEPVCPELRAGRRNIRIRVPLVRAVIEPARNLVPVRGEGAVHRQIRRQRRQAWAFVVAPDLDVLEQCDVLLGHDRVEQCDARYPYQRGQPRAAALGV